MKDKDIYGTCSCGKPLSPVWYEQEEYDSYHNKTGKTHKACDYLICEFCGKTYIVDDSFDCLAR